MRIYERDGVCGFRFTRASWGELSNFWPLPVPVPAGPWTFATSEHLYQAAKFAGRPDLQERIALAPRAKDAKAIGRTVDGGIGPDWDRWRIDVMRWVLRCKHETNRAEIDRVLAATGDRPIVEVSTRDSYWGARPTDDRYQGRNVLGRLWMELRQQVCEGDPNARSGAWIGCIRIGRLGERDGRAG